MKYFVYDLEKTSIKNLNDLKKFAFKHNINLPEEGTCYVAKDDNDEIVVLLNERKITMIEPMISDNPLAAKKLFDLFLERNQNKIIRAFIEPTNIKLLNKLGFNQEFEDLIIVERLPLWQEHQQEKKQ